MTIVEQAYLSFRAHLPSRSPATLVLDLVATPMFGFAVFATLVHWREPGMPFEVYALPLALVMFVQSPALNAAALLVREQGNGTLATLITSPVTLLRSTCIKQLPYAVEGMVMAFTACTVLGLLVLERPPALAAAGSATLAIAAGVISIIAFMSLVGALAVAAIDINILFNTAWYLLLLGCGVIIHPQTQGLWAVVSGICPLSHSVAALTALTQGEPAAVIAREAGLEALAAAGWIGTACFAQSLLARMALWRGWLHVDR
jgi:ABC-2 type transporter